MQAYNPKIKSTCTVYFIKMYTCIYRYKFDEHLRLMHAFCIFMVHHNDSYINEHVSSLIYLAFRGQKKMPHHSLDEDLVDFS